MNIWTQKEIEYLIEKYSELGPKTIGQELNRPMKQVSKQARKMGLYRGISEGNTERRNKWSFSTWSYALGYIVGTYLGDGNLYQQGESGYFRLQVIDKNYVLAIYSAIKEATGFCPSFSFSQTRQQWILNFCNRDFVKWLSTEFGSAGNKRLRVLPTVEANKGLLEGLFDSEGTTQKYSLTIRMHMDLRPLESVCKQLGIEPGKNHKGIKKQNWAGKNKQGKPMYGYTISISEWNRVGLGTYIKRKAKNDCRFKEICWK